MTLARISAFVDVVEHVYLARILRWKNQDGKPDENPRCVLSSRDRVAIDPTR
jgi:hypothetical protein